MFLTSYLYVLLDICSALQCVGRCIWEELANLRKPQHLPRHQKKLTLLTSCECLLQYPWRASIYDYIFLWSFFLSGIMSSCMKGKEGQHIAPASQNLRAGHSEKWLTSSGQTLHIFLLIWRQIQTLLFAHPHIRSWSKIQHNRASLVTTSLFANRLTYHTLHLTGSRQFCTYRGTSVITS